MRFARLASFVLSCVAVAAWFPSRVVAADPTASPVGPTASPAVPAALVPPSTQVLVASYQATGVQIYACKSADGPSGYAWSFIAPQAALVDASGKPAAKHYAGPTWEATDGSLVVGKVVAKSDATTAGAIPWLLLSAAKTDGTGIFTHVKSIQRLDTAGGVAPTTVCDATNLDKTVSVPYSATYDFFAEP